MDTDRMSRDYGGARAASWRSDTSGVSAAGNSELAGRHVRFATG